AHGPSSPVYGSVVKSSYFLAGVASAVTGLIITLFSPQISQMLSGTRDYYMYIIALGLLLPFASISTVTASIIKGNLEYMAYAKYTIIAFLAVIAVTPIAIYFFHLWGAMLVQAVFFIFPLAGYLYFNREKRFLFFSGKLGVSLIKEQSAYGF